jgi:hypothetical protein
MPSPVGDIVEGKRDGRGPYGQPSLSFTTPKSINDPGAIVVPGGGVDEHTIQFLSMICARPFPVRSVDVLTAIAKLVSA